MDSEKKHSAKKQKISALFSAIAVCLIDAFFIWNILTRSENSSFILLALIVSIAGIVGTLVALFMRLREIDKGEEYDSRNY